MSPSLSHILGTDLLGRDVLSRYLHGGRYTLLLAFGATVFALVVGTCLGIAASIGIAVSLLKAVLAGLLALPGVVIALVVLAALGRGAIPLSLAIGLSQTVPTAVIVQATILTARSQLYVEAARALGASNSYILFAHILPDIAPTLAAYGSAVFGYALLNGAALTFLGVGATPGTPDWGVMLAEGRAVFRAAPWISVAPGLTITAVVWAVNNLADSLNRQLMPDSTTVRKTRTAPASYKD
ncbi:MAG: ABC transporter permease [Aggregatilineales bacterium]